MYFFFSNTINYAEWNFMSCIVRYPAIMKTYLLKYTENFTTKNKKIFT